MVCSAPRTVPSRKKGVLGADCGREKRSWRRRRWGEWLTVIITSSLVPVEVYEIYRHSSYVKLVVLALNVAIVIYLIYHMRRQRST